MKSFTKILVMGAAFAAATPLAFADSIVGGFSLSGSDSYTSSSVTFGASEVGADHQTGKDGLSGTFLTYLTDGNTVTFVSGAIPYAQGVQTTTPFQLFTVSGADTFTFTLTGYDATYTSGILGGVAFTNLAIVGTGFFNSPGFSESNGAFDFNSSTSDGNTSTTFQTSAGSSAITPEPNSLLLLGTGLIGGAGVLFTRRRNAGTIA